MRPYFDANGITLYHGDLEVAVRRGRRVIACEIEERWCEEGARRVEWAARQQSLPGVAP